MKIKPGILAALAAMISLQACETEVQVAEDAAVPALVSGVTEARPLAAASDTSNWLSHGRTYDEQRFSPLDSVNAENIAKLGLAWFYEFPTNRGIEATPLVIDGIMIVTGSWSTVFALDAKTGEQIWAYDPEVPKAWAGKACCDVVNRGVAAWGDKVYVGTIDGYLVALNATDGSVAWRVNTIDRDKPYTITGAPRVVKGNVIIGNGGAEYGVRGYITAYDTETGNQNWRFYTVPGSPADGFENAAMEMAAETWTGEWWQYGGGGLVPDLRYSNQQTYAEWDAIVIGGSRSSNGMPLFAGVVTPEQSQAIEAYIIDRAHALR